MQSEKRDRRRKKGEPDRLAVAFLRVAALAPGGLVAGYLLGRVLGRIIAGCPLIGPCDEAVPALLTIPTSIAGMGIGSVSAATRVGRWWEGIAVLGIGIVSAFVLVVVVGWSGHDSLAASLVALGWLTAAAGVTLFTWWPYSIIEGGE